MQPCADLLPLGFTFYQSPPSIQRYDSHAWTGRQHHLRSRTPSKSGIGHSYYASFSRSRLQMSRGSAGASAENTSLTPWLKSNNCKVDDRLDLSYSDQRAKLGAKIAETASSTALKKTELAVLEETVYLTSRTARTALEKICPALKRLNEISPGSWLALQFLHERAKGSESKISPLLSFLPQPGDLDSAPLWSRAQLEWIRGSAVYERATEIQGGVETEWERLREKCAAGLFANPNSQFSLELYRWAVALVDARGVSTTDGDEFALVPVVHQLLQVPKDPSAQIQFGSTGMFFNAKPCVKVVLRQDLKAGGIVSITFGEVITRNSDLLLERGVSAAEESANSVEVAFSLTTMDPFYEDKIAIIEQYGAESGLAASPTFVLQGGVRRVAEQLDIDESIAWRPPEYLDAYLRLVCLGGGDAFLLEGVFFNEVWDHMSLPVSAENEANVCATMINACEDALESYTVAEDAQMPSGLDEASETRWALAKGVTDGERRILRQALAAYARRQKTLDAIEYYAERRLNALDLLRPVDESEVVDSESGARVGRAFDENY